MSMWWKGAKGVRTKFGNRHVPCELGGRHHTHDSMAERGRCGVLHIKQGIGDIYDLRIHHRWKLDVNGVEVTTYEDDFNYIKRGESQRVDCFVVEDVKSPPTKKLESYQIKKALMLAIHGVEILETS